MQLLRIAIALVLLTPLTALAQEKQGARLTAKDLAGTYAMVSCEKHGEPLPEERIAGTTVKITEERITATDKDSQETFSCTYKLDASQTPAVITMVNRVQGMKGQVAKGLIQREGDTVRLIYSLPDTLEPPAKFKTGAGELMVVLKLAGGDDEELPSPEK